MFTHLNKLATFLVTTYPLIDSVTDTLCYVDLLPRLVFGVPSDGVGTKDLDVSGVFYDLFDFFVFRDSKTERFVHHFEYGEWLHPFDRADGAHVFLTPSQLQVIAYVPSTQTCEVHIDIGKPFRPSLVPESLKE